jgi:hypothetical protein
MNCSWGCSGNHNDGLKLNSAADTKSNSGNESILSCFEIRILDSMED